MSHWCDDEGLNRQQRALDAEQAEYARKMKTDTQYAAGFKAGIEAAAEDILGWNDEDSLPSIDYMAQALYSIPIPDAPDLTLTPDEVRHVRQHMQSITNLGMIWSDSFEKQVEDARNISRDALAILDGKGKANAD